MTRAEAINALNNGHGLWSVEFTGEVLEALNIVGGVPKRLIIEWDGQDTANPDHDPKGIFLTEDKPGQGVHSLRVGYYVCAQLGIESAAGNFFGRGWQARTNATAIDAYFKELEAK